MKGEVQSSEKVVQISETGKESADQYGMEKERSGGYGNMHDRGTKEKGGVLGKRKRRASNAL